MMRCSHYFLCIVACSMFVGCLPRTTVTKNPGPRDEGIRYYRPKPYLSIKPLTDNSGIPQPGYVTIETVTLPDFSEEYSIHIRSGLGINNTEIQLDNGWNLTALNVHVDSQFDENLKAAAELVKAIPPEKLRANLLTTTTVRATNVPIGLYEAVLSKDPNCAKRLYGFRYVGFMPFSSCPIESSGLEYQGCCEGQVYGLVFEGDAMVFRPLVDLPSHITDPNEFERKKANDKAKAELPEMTNPA